jgi:core-2/I-Branching enzyme
MRVCYFIQNHLAPPQVGRLVGTLRRSQPGSFILVGHDEFAGFCAASELRQALNVDVFAAREPAKRGYFSLLEPYFDAVAWLADQGIAYDWLVYLSAQDYPTRPLRDFADLLAATGCDGFLRFWDAAAPVNPWGRRRQGVVRYGYQYFDAPAWALPLLRALRAGNGLQPFVHCHLTYGPRIGVRRRRQQPFHEGFRCYAGTQWTVLRRACAEYVAERVRGGDPLVQWFRRTICPDEAVVQTLLVNSGRFQLVDDDLRFVDVSGSRDGRPRTLTVKDLPTLTSGRHYFARKFDASGSSEVLDLLDARIG